LVDPEVVRRRLRQIDQRVTALRRVSSIGERTFAGDLDLQAQAERHLQIAIQAAIDIAIHMLAEDTAATPEDYGSAFLLLAGQRVIPAPLAQRLRRAAGLRNILVHAYLDIDPHQVWRHLADVGDLLAFAAAVETYLGKDSG
jgi:uncharacterized protein YutE (UPF0331/DUF86 family)